MSSRADRDCNAGKIGHTGRRGDCAGSHCEQKRKTQDDYHRFGRASIASKMLAYLAVSACSIMTPAAAEEEPKEIAVFVGKLFLLGLIAN